MSLATPAWSPILFTALIGVAYYRRLRSNFGTQPWRPRRTLLRLGILSIALIALTTVAVLYPNARLGIGVGVLIGGLLGGLSLQHTHTQLLDGSYLYTPNPWIGGALSLLLLGRLAWRMGSGALSAGGAQMSQKPSVLTLAIAATLVGYYLVYGIGLSLRMRALAPPDSNA